MGEKRYLGSKDINQQSLAKQNRRNSFSPALGRRVQQPLASLSFTTSTKS
jgi:hypothetical protein